MLNDVITVLHQQLYFQSKHRKLYVVVEGERNPNFEDT